MFEGQESLLGASEKIEYTQEQQLEIMKCMSDPIYFIEHFFHIQTNDFGYIIPKLRPYQKKMIKAFIKTPSGRRHLVMLCPRRAAKTCTIAMCFAWYAIFNKEQNLGIFAQTQEMSIEILEMIKAGYERLPLWLQVGVKQWSAKTIRLGNGTRIIASATSARSGRGKAFSKLFLDEFAFVNSGMAKKFISSVFPTVESGKLSTIIISSTPFGLNHFSDIWYGAQKEEDHNNFFPIRVLESEVPRNKSTEEFKKEIIARDGLMTYEQEYACAAGDTKVTLKDKSGKIFSISLSDLKIMLRQT